MKILKTSRLFETPPAYVIDQPAFLNCAAEVMTSFYVISPVYHLTSVDRHGHRAVRALAVVQIHRRESGTCENDPKWSS